jgi:hypothetical protein
VGVSIGLYLIAQFLPELNLPRYRPSLGSDGKWFFNVLAWQLLFFIGMVLGSRNRLGISNAMPKRMAWIFAAVLFIAVSPLLKVGGVLFHLEIQPLMQAIQEERLYESIEELTGISDEDIYAGKGAGLAFPLSDKRRLQPMRLLHFFAAVYLVAVLLPSRLRFWQSRISAVFGLCGRHSLEVFCFSIVLNYIVGLWLQVHGGGAWHLLLYAGVGFALMTGLAYLLEHGQPKKRAVV